MILSDDGTVLIEVHEEDINEYGVFQTPEGVTHIATAAFQALSTLRKVIFSDSVTHMAESMFAFCDHLNEIIMGNGVTHIPESGFSNLAGLKNFVFSDSVTHIGNCAFSYCIGLTKLILGKNVTYLGEGAFLHCTDLKEFVMGNSVTYMGLAALGNCPNLHELVIPSSITSLDKRSFYFPIKREWRCYLKLIVIDADDEKEYNRVLNFLPEALKIKAMRGDIYKKTIEVRKSASEQLAELSFGNSLPKVMREKIVQCDNPFMQALNEIPLPKRQLEEPRYKLQIDLLVGKQKVIMKLNHYLRILNLEISYSLSSSNGKKLKKAEGISKLLRVLNGDIDIEFTADEEKILSQGLVADYLSDIIKTKKVYDAEIIKIGLDEILTEYLNYRRDMMNSSAKRLVNFHGIFAQKNAAVQALQGALSGQDIDLSIYLPTLRNGRLGRILREFVKHGEANYLTEHPVTSVSDFIGALEAKNRNNAPSTAAPTP